MAGVVIPGRHRALLDGLSLSVNAGEIHALVGPPLAGKSIAVGVLMGLRRPSLGLSQIQQFDCFFQAAAVRRHATFVPNGGQFDPTLSPRAHAAWVLKLSGEMADAIAIRRALRQSEVPDRYFDTPYAAVPGGYAVLTWLAIAMLRRHRILVMDDPTDTLTSVSILRVGRMLRQFAQSGAAVLVATRDLRFAEGVSNTVTCLDMGQADPPLNGLAPERLEA